MNISLSEWKGWAPGINSPEDWPALISGQVKLDLSLKPDVSFLPAMFRRKLTPLSRMIFHTVNQLEAKETLSTVPVIFGSRHGELDISIDLITSELSKTPFSPAKFSMSVHNSPPGLLSIHYKNTAPANAVSAGRRTLEMSLIEAQAMLTENEKCLLVYADLPLVEIYSDYEDEESFPICLAMLLDKNANDFSIDFDTPENFSAACAVAQLCSFSGSSSNRLL